MVQNHWTERSLGTDQIIMTKLSNSVATNKWENDRECQWWCRFTQEERETNT